jgi:tetratricopeptide (TPR) repeat protein
MKDSFGHDFSGANDASLQALLQAQDELRCYLNDPAASVELALSASPDMTMAHVMKAWLYLLGTEPGGIAVARACCEAAAALPANEREQQHLKAASLLAHGHLQEAARVLEDLSLRYPHDLLALQAGHQIDFFRGDSRMLRDRIARALPAWGPGQHGRHAVLSMYAFGLEETGDYAGAERFGRQALELEPRDGWAWHAVAHVLEMRNDPAAGVAWLAPQAAVWSRDSFFAVHNWWHLALFHLELGLVDEVLRLYDGAIAGTGSSLMLDLVDASAMLWRLKLRGVDAGARWTALAERWAAASVPGLYAFNDVHAMMAYTGAGQAGRQRELLEAQRAAMERDNDNAGFTREVGEPVLRALQALSEGEGGRAAALLRRIRSQAHRFGGSHAQRDVIDLTLLAAARQAGDRPLADGLAAERERLRPWAARVAARAPQPQNAQGALLCAA